MSTGSRERYCNDGNPVPKSSIATAEPGHQAPLPDRFPQAFAGPAQHAVTLAVTGQGQVEPVIRVEPHRRPAPIAGGRDRPAGDR